MKNGTYEDLIQEGRIGLFKAIKSYKVEKNIKFSTFANCCIRSQIITAIRKSNSPKELFLTSAVSYLELNGDEINKEDYVLYRSISQNYNSPEQIILNNEMWELLQTYLSQNLSKLEKSTFIYLYNGYTYQEIAVIFKVNPKVIDNTIQRIKRKIKDYLKNN